jgi:M6 family metalloprotease-like protein
MYGSWDLMSNNWSTTAIELNAWNHYIQGWLSDSQIQCLVRGRITTPIDTLITPIVRENSSPKAIVIKLSDTKVLVIESRRNEGLDKLSAAQEGTLV